MYLLIMSLKCKISNNNFEIVIFISKNKVFLSNTEKWQLCGFACVYYNYDSV